ncbi:ergothioneine biosynthesis protein EgtC [Planomonospora venezuelensis]|uniref:Gamma-glutamyl-hercynylcysteine sulfoxide hydrolase n=1 Tax=Planomonospora venezuelensis TaxID=1999 RepID=A0A841DG69_PLAVE|nr:ergothioneine biosynthesis protein EgtC [Planomonospora venezuelensis]MBB5967085.1 glutamine amidotransferase [Planomonospora venezuelensis]GIN04925.1 gamma-glutamyl-hercynylcysteine sulfoxide hydrolase [Planomonospora venezuelensis]
MCRHAAWLGAPRALASLIHEPEHGLLRQSYAPRLQRYGTVNADGYGMGWYDSAHPEPVRYRRAVPAWTDANLPALARVARSHCLLAAVRSATVGMPVEETATAPFTDGRWLLSHNGRVSRDAVGDLAGDLPDGAESSCDSAWLAAAVFLRLRAGLPLGDALAGVVAHAGAKDPGARLNLLACDGASLAATVWGDTLFLRHDDGSGAGGGSGGGVLVASEPLDGRPGWQAVPERSLLLVSSGGVHVQPI